MSCVVLLANAKKYQIGDYVEYNSIPCIVVYVDSTGEHGYLMSAAAITDSEYKDLKKSREQILKSYLKKSIKKIDKTDMSQSSKDSAKMEIQKQIAFAVHIDSLSEKMPILKTKTFEVYDTPSKKVKKYRQDLLASNSEYGKSNTESVIKYCKDNNLDIEQNFPREYFAYKLGDGWFIPGTYEMELVRTSWWGGFGEKYALEEKLAGTKLREYWKNDLRGDMFPIMTATSTMTDSEWGKRKENLEKVDKVIIGGRFSGFAVPVALGKTTAYFGCATANPGVFKGFRCFFFKNPVGYIYEPRVCAMRKF